MEYVPGQSMAEVLRERGRLPAAEAVEVLGQACRGLEYAHRGGVVHRDVKPGNLLRSDDGQVKLADFGIAKAAEQSDITKTGSVIGTAAYLAPEQARGEPAGPGADIYALGVVSYQLMAGRLPYDAPSLTELARQQEAGLPPALNELVPDVPAELSEAIDRALAPTPEERYSDALAFERALADGLRGIAQPDDERTASTQMLASDAGRTERTRALPRTSHQPAPPPAAPRRGLQPIEGDYAPAAAPQRYAPAPAQVATRGHRRRRRGLVPVLMLLILAAIATGGVLWVASDDPRSLQLKEDVRGDVNQAADELLDLIRENTR